MEKNTFLDRLTEFTVEAVKDYRLPTKMQSGDEEQGYRAAEVYKMRLPDSNSAKKKAPYIIHQVVTSKDIQPKGEPVQSTAQVRTMFCVYYPDEQEGALALLNLMELVRTELLRVVVIGDQYMLDTTAGLETLIYDNDTAPFYVGEMATTWILPAVQREVCT